MASTQVTTPAGFRNVLVATDFSEVSESALRTAAAIAQVHSGRLFITHVMEAPQPGRPLLLHKPSSLEPGRSAAEYRMQVLAAQDYLGRIPHSEILETGEVCEVVPDLIERNNIDLLVLGTHARAGVKKLMQGSVSEELFRLAPCPVITVGPEVASETSGSVRFARILFATDFGPASRAALPYAMGLANENGAILTLLHVIPPLPALSIGSSWYPGTNPGELQRRDTEQTLERLRDLIPSGAFLTHEPKFAVVFDAIPAGILQAAIERHADLIVMGVKAAAIRGARTSSHLPWATAHEVVAHACCPVITVRG